MTKYGWYRLKCNLVFDGIEIGLDMDDHSITDVPGKIRTVIYRFCYDHGVSATKAATIVACYHKRQFWNILFSSKWMSRANCTKLRAALRTPRNRRMRSERQHKRGR